MIPIRDMDAIKNFNIILNSFKINAQCVNYQKVDNYFHYDLHLNSNVKIRDIQKISDEIALALKAPGKPSFKILHQEGIVRLEFAQVRTTPLKLTDLFKEYSPVPGELPCLLGRQSNGQDMWMDLSQNPHMIVAGTTGSGKSTLLHNIIGNLLKINNVDIHLVDPKKVEFDKYSKFKNISVDYDYSSALEVINSIYEFMELRYSLLRQGHSASAFKPIVIIIDEFADLIVQDENRLFYSSLCKLSQKCRAAKIYMILATQRPSVNVIDGTIKANFPARIACRVASHVDSKVVLDTTGAEDLAGRGDALVRDNFRNLDRFQIAYASAEDNINYFSK